MNLPDNSVSFSCKDSHMKPSNPFHSQRMIMKKLQFGLLLCMGLLASACTTNINPDTYSVGSTQRAQRSVSGVIVGARPVNVQGTSQTGTLIGAAAGGVAGSAIGGSSRANILGAIGGAVLGGIAGNMVEKGITNQTGVEYTVRTNNGGTITLVQGTSPTFAVGQKVLIVYGKEARIIADTAQ